MKALRALTAFSGRQDGGVAIIFGLSILVLGLAAGLAIDYARAFSIETSLRADLDAAVLGAASSISDPSAIQARALSFFDDNWKRKHAVSDVVLNVTQTDHTKLTGTATATMPTTLMRLGGFETMTLSAISEVEVAGGNVELSLVLDTTASMFEEIESVKGTLKTVLSKLDSNVKIRVGLVEYKDRADTFVTKTYALTTDLKSLSASIQGDPFVRASVRASVERLADLVLTR